ncbi:MAG: hypothetical protein JXR37_22155 [Kiritimatiellae bacterium]|nr:hypothetical protein [Kiritimatiellia bacterium]
MDKKRKEEFSKQMHALWEQTTVKWDEVKEAVVRSYQAGRVKLDVLLLKREAEQLFHKLGEQTYRQVKAKKIAATGPLQSLVKKLDKLMRQIEREEKQARRTTGAGGKKASASTSAKKPAKKKAAPKKA